MTRLVRPNPCSRRTRLDQARNGLHTAHARRQLHASRPLENSCFLAGKPLLTLIRVWPILPPRQTTWPTRCEIGRLKSDVQSRRHGPPKRIRSDHVDESASGARLGVSLRTAEQNAGMDAGACFETPRGKKSPCGTAAQQDAPVAHRPIAPGKDASPPPPWDPWIPGAFFALTRSVSEGFFETLPVAPRKPNRCF